MRDLSTEQKIVIAANKIFTQKGFASTRTRDIAEEAGINQALLNYYFRSKENLFKLVVKDKLKMLFDIMVPIISNNEITLNEKIKSITNNYTNLLLENEDLPLFILNEWSVNKELFLEITQNARLKAQPAIEKQLRENGIEISAPNFISNILGMIMFPFVAKSMLISSGLLKEEEFVDFVNNRKENILEWIIKTTK